MDVEESTFSQDIKKLKVSDSPHSQNIALTHAQEVRVSEKNKMAASSANVSVKRPLFDTGSTVSVAASGDGSPRPGSRLLQKGLMRKWILFCISCRKRL